MEEWRSNDMVNHQNDEGGDCVRELMDEHDKEEVDKVKEVRMILARRNLCTTGMDDASVRRFLRARAMDVKEAAKMVADDVAWRADVVPSRGYVLETEIESELNVEKAYLQGVSKGGHPIILVLAHRHFPNKRHPLHFKRFVVYTLDKAIASAPKGIEKCLVIVDIKGVGYKNMDLKGMLLGLQILQDHYPERLEKLYFVNVSTLWIAFWKYASHLVDKVTLEKVNFLPSSNTMPLLQDVDEDVLPTPYGGRAEMILIQDAHVPSWPPT